MIKSIINPIRASLKALLLASALLCVSIPGTAKEFVVVIDAGHGGKDSGALGKTSKEKDINLAVARKLGDEIASRFKDTKVVYTRTNDVFVTIKGRMDKAKAVKADLFISLHCNSAALENPRRSSLSGTSVFVLGTNNANDNIDLAMRENSAILLEDDYKTTYKGFDNSPEYYIFTEINQSKMMGKSNSIANAVQRQLVSHAGLKDNRVNETSRLWLLLHSTMPAILIELDFICNPVREQFLNSADGQKKMAQAICNGIRDYRLSLGHSVGNAKPSSTLSDHTTSAPTPPGKSAAGSKDKAKPSDKSPTETPSVKNSTTVFKIQFLSSPSKRPEGSPKLKGIDRCESYRDGTAYKYTYGSYPTMEAATAHLKEIRAKFPDAFIIKMIDGKRIK